MVKSSYKKSKAAREKIRKREEAERKRWRKYPYAVTLRQSCGCCESTLRFKSRESFLAQWNQMQLTSMGEITDDSGARFTNLDTFYGYVEGEENNRGFEYLVKRLSN